MQLNEIQYLTGLSQQIHSYTKYKDILYPFLYQDKAFGWNLTPGQKWIPQKDMSKIPMSSVCRKLWKSALTYLA